MKMSKVREEILTNGIQTVWPQLHALSLLQAAFKKLREDSWLLEAGQPVLCRVTLAGSRDADVLLKHLVLSPVGPSALRALWQLSSPAKDLVQKAKLVSSFQPREKEKIAHPCQSLVLVPGAPADRLAGAHSAPPALLEAMHVCVRVWPHTCAHRSVTSTSQSPCTSFPPLRDLCKFWLKQEAHRLGGPDKSFYFYSTLFSDRILEFTSTSNLHPSGPIRKARSSR